MKSRTVLLVVAANLAVLLALVFYAPHLMISPGKPIAAHEEVATDCFACHTPFLGSDPEKCIACHEVAEIGRKTTKGLTITGEKKSVAFHQQLIEHDCLACHSEHKGVQPFRPIGQFSHQLLEPAIQDDCGSCHSSPGDALHRKIQGSCGSCHSQDAWTPATFEHDEYFRFDRHHDADCVTCHVDNDYDAYTCYGCHEHSRSKIREEHLEEGIRDYENCVDCHRSGDEDEAEYLWRQRRLRGSGVQDFFPERSDERRHHEDRD